MRNNILIKAYKIQFAKHASRIYIERERLLACNTAFHIAISDSSEIIPRRKRVLAIQRAI